MGPKFAEVAREMTERIKGLCPNPLREKMKNEGGGR